MADQQYCLRWNNHQTTLVSIFDVLLQRNRFTDCTISAENQSLAAHKILLTACSPYFETVLSQIRDDKHPVIVLKDVTFAELKALMDYMYRGEVNISQDQLAALLKVAESLQIKGLSDSGEKEKPEKRPAPLPPPPTHNIPLVPRSSGLTIEHSRRSNQAQVLDLPLDSPLNRQDGSISPGPRKRKRTRRRSSGDEASLGQTLPMTESLDSNSRDTTTTSIPLNVASLLSKTAVIPEPNLNDHALPDSAHVDLPKTEPLSDLDLIQPKEEYVDDHEDSVENITLDDDDDMDDMDLSQAGPSHGGEGSSSQGYPPSWQQASDRSNDEVFMAAQEAVGGQRDSQGKNRCTRLHSPLERFMPLGPTLGPTLGCQIFSTHPAPCKPCSS